MSNIIDKIRLSGVTYTLSGQSGGGNPTVELTQAEYDALVSAGTVSADTYYIITDAQGGDLSNYWTSAQTQSAINQATSGKASQSDLETVSGQVANKQDTLVSGTNIKTINNTSILGSGNIDIQGGGGGGKAVSGGTNISITTGETVDTINCTLPITADTKHNYHFIHSYNTSGSENVTFGTNNDINANGSFIVGGSNHAYGNGSFIHGYSCIANKLRSHLVGDNLLSRNSNESSFGKYNSTTSASTTFGDSGNTLFSVGNGTADNARHNAFEIRQNGDIYLSSGGTDIKLQDHLGSGGGGITIDPSLDSGSTNAVANSAITEAFNGTTYGSPSTFSNSFVGSRTAYVIIYDVPNVEYPTIWFMRCYDSSVPAFTSIGIKDNDNFYDNQSQIMTDIPNWIDQELSYYDSTTRKRYVFLKNGVYADYFNNVNGNTFTIFETNNTGLIGSLLSKHSIDTDAHTTSAEKSVWNAKLDSSAITTSISSSSTDAQVPSAKAVYDIVGNIETLLSQI